MAYTQTQLDALDAAIASGELIVKYDGREVTYRSIDQLIKARDFVFARLPTTQRRVSYSIAFIDRG
jgi:hypothetical protein